MTTWLPITYRGFWDVPRIFVVRDGGRLYLFDCPFSQELDDYPDDYIVYLLPELREEELPEDWTTLAPRAVCQLGTVPVSQVQFDETRRKQVNAAILNDMLGTNSQVG